MAVDVSARFGGGEQIVHIDGGITLISLEKCWNVYREIF